MEMWKNELDSASGDKTKGARTFIHTVLPYLSEVIAQDGVLWAKHHAQNPAFLAVQNQLDGKTGSQNYAAWCQQKYAEIKDDAETCILRRERTDELNAKLAKRVQDLDSIYVRLQRQAEMMVSCMFFFCDKKITLRCITYRFHLRRRHTLHNCATPRRMNVLALKTEVGKVSAMEVRGWGVEKLLVEML